MSATYALDDYRDQIRSSRSDRTTGTAERSNPGAHRIARYADERLSQRYENLQAACGILADGLDELHDEIQEYVKSVPLPTRDSGNGDTERFLTWLGQRAGLTSSRTDEKNANGGRHSVEFVAVKQRLAHVRFQELLSMNERLLPQLTVNGKLTVHLNPIHVWSWFDTVVAGEETDSAPSAVLFFPVADDIRTAEVEADCADLLRFLERRGPLTIKDLCKLCLPGERPMVLRMIRNLAELGMIALG